jgi:hypothetical protein
VGIIPLALKVDFFLRGKRSVASIISSISSRTICDKENSAVAVTILGQAAIGTGLAALNAIDGCAARARQWATEDRGSGSLEE